MNIYGYCRISTAKQSIDRQIRNIKAEYPTAHIVQEAYTGTSIFRPEWLKLYRILKAGEAKQIIRTHCKTFGGTLDDAECMKLTGLARNTYYKYKRQIRAELMAEQDLPKGASIFYEPPKSF